MKIGLVSAILEDYDFKKMIDTVSEIGYECVEVACWPKAKAERRYAGVSHIDVANLGDQRSRRNPFLLQRKECGDFRAGVLSEHHGWKSEKKRLPTSNTYIK